MKFLVFSDIHFTNSNSKFRKDGDGVSDLLRAQYKFIEFMADELAEDDYDAWLFLGDLTDHNTLDTITSYYVNKSLALLDSTGVPGIMLGGNHTITDQGNVYSVLSALSQFNWSTDTKFFHNNGEYVLDGTHFYVCPYNSDYLKVENDIKLWNNAIEDDGLSHVLLFHFPTKNGMLDNGLPSTSGVNLSQDIISNFDLVIGGDFHMPQKIEGTESAYYVGAPFDLKFGQTGDRQITRIEIDDDGYDVLKLANPFNYNMVKMSPDDLLGQSEQDMSRWVVRLDEPPDASIRPEVEALRDKVYSLYIPRLKFESAEDGGDDTEDVFILDSDTSSKDDLKVLSGELDRVGVDKETKDKAIEIFQKVSNS